MTVPIPTGRFSNRRQVRTTAITTEGEEVELPRLLITDALAFHALRGYSNRETLGAGK
jgi:hypothetical protein